MVKGTSASFRADHLHAVDWLLWNENVVVSAGKQILDLGISTFNLGNLFYVNILMIWRAGGGRADLTPLRKEFPHRRRNVSSLLGIKRTKAHIFMAVIKASREPHAGIFSATYITVTEKRGSWVHEQCEHWHSHVGSKRALGVSALFHPPSTPTAWAVYPSHGTSGGRTLFGRH